MPGTESKTWQRCLRDAATGDPDAWGLVRGITVWDLILGCPMGEGHLLALAAPGCRLVGDRRAGQAAVGAAGTIVDPAGREMVHCWRLGLWHQTAPWDIANPEVAVVVDVLRVFDTLDQTPWLEWARGRTDAHLRRLRAATAHPHHPVPQQGWITEMREAANELRRQSASAEPGERWWRDRGKATRGRFPLTLGLSKHDTSYRTVEDLLGLAEGTRTTVVQELPEFDLRPAELRAGGRKPCEAGSPETGVGCDPVYDSPGKLIWR